jgi:DsbC/DsbD-like thiol-disulfide interchange protein
MHYHRLKIMTLTCLFAWLLSGLCVQAGSTGLKSVRILSGWQNQDGTYITALELILEKGWKTYWRSPGETGLPPYISFSRSRNLKTIRIIWPSPVVFGPKEMWSVGYKDRLILPLRITPKDRAAPVTLTLDAMVGICENICVPAEFTLSQELQAGVKKRHPRIVAALVNRPKSAAEATVESIDCEFSLSHDEMSVEIKLSLPHVGKRETVMIEYEQPGHWVRLSSSDRTGQILVARAKINRSSGPIVSIERSKVRITVVSTNTSVDIGTCSK